MTPATWAERVLAEALAAPKWGELPETAAFHHIREAFNQLGGTPAHIEALAELTQGWFTARDLEEA